jgi:hypothetical protein
MAESDYLARNCAYRDDQAHAYAEAGERKGSGEPSWGIWSVPEAELGLGPAEMTGLDAIWCDPQRWIRPAGRRRRVRYGLPSLEMVAVVPSNFVRWMVNGSL